MDPGRWGDPGVGVWALECVCAPLGCVCVCDPGFNLQGHQKALYKGFYKVNPLGSTNHGRKEGRLQVPGHTCMKVRKASSLYREPWTLAASQGWRSFAFTRSATLPSSDF